ncbi:MAG: sensor histidine kinase [Pseudomonadota bacterium]
MTPHTPPHPDVMQSLAFALVAASTTPLLLLDDDLNVVTASASFGTAFRMDPALAISGPLAGLGGGEWNIPQLGALLKATMSGYAQVEDYEMNLAREGRPTRHLILNARKLAYDGGDGRLLLSIQDVTEVRSAQKRADDALRDKDILLQELHHRVANSLQIIASVLMQSARKVQSEEARNHLNQAHHRVMSVAALQKQLAATRLGDVELRPYFTALCDSISASMIRDPARLTLKVMSDDSITTADTSTSLGLIVTELVINALKHAFPLEQSGIILVDYQAQGLSWTLSVKDDGVGMPANPQDAKPGLGTSIVQALAKQLSAEIIVAGGNPGTSVSIVHTHVPILLSLAGAQIAQPGLAV